MQSRQKLQSIIECAEDAINKMRSVILMAKSRGGRVEPFELEMIEKAIEIYDNEPHRPD